MVVPSPDWFEVAPCRGRDELFFSTRPTLRAQAMKICQTCPYQRSCLEWVAQSTIRAGVWAGKYGRDLEKAIEELELVK